MLPPGGKLLSLSLSHASPPRALAAARAGGGGPASPGSPRQLAPRAGLGAAAAAASSGAGVGEDLDLMYDPVLNCYCALPRLPASPATCPTPPLALLRGACRALADDPKTNKYYELA